MLAGEVYSVLQSLPGTELVDEVLLFAADPVTGKRGEPVQRIDIGRERARVQLRAPRARDRRGSDMRGVVPDLLSPVPLITRLPAILQEDEFLQSVRCPRSTT